MILRNDQVLDLFREFSVTIDVRHRQKSSAPIHLHLKPRDEMKLLLSILACIHACTANADEPWMYPVSIPTSPTLAELKSATMKVSYVESNGAKPFEGTR
tara:strand:+ start:628 stop:927 length:300 start_codon:yes stop_codon:yes gene_type:complete